MTVHRTTERPPLAIVRGGGLELSRYRCENGTIRAGAAGAGTSRLKLAAASRPDVRLDGRPLEVRFDAGRGRAEAELTLRTGQIYELEISLS